jgi:hypothetical protein
MGGTWSFFEFKKSKAQSLNVRQPSKLGTIIIHTICILLHESAVTDSLPEGEFVHGHSNLLPNDLARQWCRYTSVPIQAAYIKEPILNLEYQGTRLYSPSFSTKKYKYTQQR